MTLAISFLIFWLLCGFLAAGFEYAYFQREYPNRAEKGRHKDKITALSNLVWGPAGLVPVLVHQQYTHGWLLPGRKP